MFRGIFALFFRSLKSESRSFWFHFSRFVLLLMFYFGLAAAQEQASTRAAPGLTLFQYTIYANATFLTLLGISYFSTAISEEREEDTLGLISLAGLSSLGLLLGKSTTRLFQVLLFLVLQYPFTLLAITLGGLTPDQIMGAYLALAAYAVLIANVGLFCSVVCRRNRDAAALTFICLIVYAVTPFFALFLSNVVDAHLHDVESFWAWIAPYLKPSLDWLAATNIFSELGQITASTYQFHLSPQVISNVIGGVLIFFASWWLFGVIEHDEVSNEPLSTAGRNSSAFRNSFRAGRTWKWAIVWKDFHFVAGGWYGITIRLAVYTGLFLIGVVTHLQVILEQHASLIFTDLVATYRLFVVPIFLIDCAICFSRPFQDEIREQTLSSLLLLPHSVWHVVSAKVAGCLIGLTPGMIAISLACFIPIDGEDVQNKIVSYEFCWLMLICLLVLELCAVLSTFLRLGVILTAFAMTFGIIIAAGLCAEALEIPDTDRPGYFLIQIGFPLAAVIACHPILISRLSRLGSR